MKTRPGAPITEALTAGPSLTLTLALGSLFVVTGPLAAQEARGAKVPEASSSPSTSPTPGCWIRGERRDLELRISRLDSATVELADGTVKVCYSRPRKLGRPIMDRLVPFGEPWRLGANEATVLHLPFPATVAGVALEPGSYSLYAIPGESTWRIVVNGNARRWGIPIDEEIRKRNIGSGTVPAERLEKTVGKLTIRLRRLSSDSAKMRIEWERTGVSVPIVRRE